jgi:hypothetical protein
MSSESVCHVARSWMDGSSFHTPLVVRFMIFTASVRNILDTPSHSMTNSHTATGTSACYIVSHLRSFWKVKKWSVFGKSAEFLLVGMEAQLDECGGGILLGDNRELSLLAVVDSSVWGSDFQLYCLVYAYFITFLLISNLRKILLAPSFPERNYFVNMGSLYHSNDICTKYINYSVMSLRLIAPFQNQ